MRWRRRRAFLKAATGPGANGELNLLSVPSGAGTVDHIWLACRPGSGGGYPEFDLSIRVYTDGNTAPDVDMDLGTFFGYGLAAQFPAPANIHTKHFYARYGGPAWVGRTGGGVRMTFPFNNGIRVAVANVNNSPTAGVFSQVDYTLAVDNPTFLPPSYRLKVAGNKWVGGALAIAAQADASLATLTGPGVIVAHSMAMGQATAYDYLERYVAISIDGEVTPSIQSSGTEDWFLGSDYWYTGQSPMSGHAAMALGAASDTLYTSSALVDLKALHGGYAFGKSATVSWLHHPATTSNCSFSSAIFYEQTI